jgi:hypothetical protein
MNYIWPSWLVLIAISFAGLESYALATGKPTLSRFIWTLSAAWAPFPWFAGFLAGFLVCHFWWGGAVTFAPVIKGVKGWFS